MGEGGGGGVLFQAEDGIRNLVRSRGLGDVYKRQGLRVALDAQPHMLVTDRVMPHVDGMEMIRTLRGTCLLYTSDAADERSSVDLGGRRIIHKKLANDAVSHLLSTHHR